MNNNNYYQNVMGKLSTSGQVIHPLINLMLCILSYFWIKKYHSLSKKMVVSLGTSKKTLSDVGREVFFHVQYYYRNA